VIIDSVLLFEDERLVNEAAQMIREHASLIGSAVHRENRTPGMEVFHL
jgi:hypothetical protein